VCHGKVAFGANACARCHVAMGGPVAQAQEKPSAPDAPQGPGTELKTWEEASKALPQASNGGVDWVAAVDEGAIAPQAGLTPEAKPKDIFDLDVELVPEAGEMFKALFPHKAHTAVLGCENSFRWRRGRLRSRWPRSTRASTAGCATGRWRSGRTRAPGVTPRWPEGR
jgi:hypothetical protein